MGGVLLDLAKDVAQGSRDDASVCVTLSSSCDCESFSRACLSIRKNGPIVPIKGTVNYILRNVVEDSLLARKHIHDPVKLESVELLPSLLDFERVFGKSKLNLPIFRVKLHRLVSFLGGLDPHIDLNSFGLGHL